MASTLIERMTGKKAKPWTGVDFDGTLAKHVPGKHASDKLGEPVKRMVDRVKRWLDDGKHVKIFTARADDEKSVNAIKDWLKDNDLPDLDVTNLKDKDMVEFWDDRAVEVERDTGKRVSESIVDSLIGEGEDDDMVGRLTMLATCDQDAINVVDALLNGTPYRYTTDANDPLARCFINFNVNPGRPGEAGRPNYMGFDVGDSGGGQFFLIPPKDRVKAIWMLTNVIRNSRVRSRTWEAFKKRYMVAYR